MKFSYTCVVCLCACTASTKTDASMMLSSSRLAEDGACADESTVADHTSLLQTTEFVITGQTQKGAASSGARTPDRHGPDEGTSQPVAPDFDKARRAKRRPVPPAVRPNQRKQGDSFSLFDIDGDGQLTRFEVDSVFQKNSPAGADDENSFLQTEEFNAAAAIFDKFDVDGDGLVSREEYDLQQYEAIHAQRRLEMLALRTGADNGSDAGEQEDVEEGLQYQ